MSTTPRSGSPSESHNSNNRDDLPDNSMLVEHSTPAYDAGRSVFNGAQSDSGMSPTESKGKQVSRDPQIPAMKSQNPGVISPSTAGGRMGDFDWNAFEQRYLEALEEADGKEQQILEEFDQLVAYFTAWAAASSTHDDERAIKRLQTRSRHVQLSEQRLTQKKQHMSEVVKAFQSALALLSST